MRLGGSVTLLVLGASLGGCAESDTFEDFFPDPADRTLVMIGGTDEAVRSYWSAYQRIPEDLDEAMAGIESHAVFKEDAWGERIRYERTGHSYCLWSAGGDGVFETSDDLGVLGGMVEGDLRSSRASAEDIAAHCLGEDGV